MLLQDQRDLQQHAVVMHKVELSDEAISLVSLSAPSLHVWLGLLPVIYSLSNSAEGCLPIILY